MKNNRGGKFTTGLAILLLLKQYGVLSARTIRTMLENSYTPRNIHKRLIGLAKKGLIERRLTEMSAQTSVVYQLSHKKDKILRLCSLLGCEEQDLSQKGIRYSHFYHEDLCSIVQFKLSKTYRLVHCIRDWQFHSSPAAKKLFPGKFFETRMFPDLAIAMQSLDDSGQIPKITKGLTWIGVEVERSLKADHRLAKKLDLYAAKSFFDGVLYLSPSSKILSKQSQVYLRDVAPKAIRIKHYKDAFLATAILSKENFDPKTLLVRCGTREMKFSDWLLFLLSTTQSSRKEAWENSWRYKALESPMNT